jgi:hypothetical protein
MKAKEIQLSILKAKPNEQIICWLEWFETIGILRFDVHLRRLKKTCSGENRQDWIWTTHHEKLSANGVQNSEAQFKTLKYHSSYPKIIATLEEAKAFMRGWFQWYNNEQ